MKTLLKFLAAAVLLGAFLFCAANLSAQTFTADASTVLPVEVQNFVLAWLFKIAAVHPWVATAITILGSARLWVKPVFSLVHWLIDLTPSPDDDTRFNQLLAWFRTPLGSKVAYILDWGLSIKVIPPAKPAMINVTNSAL